MKVQPSILRFVEKNPAINSRHRKPDWLSLHGNGVILRTLFLLFFLVLAMSKASASSLNQVKVVYFLPTGAVPAKDYQKKLLVILPLVNKLLQRGLSSVGIDSPGLRFPQSQEEITLVHAKHPASFYNEPPVNFGLWPDPSAKLLSEVQRVTGKPKDFILMIFAETNTDRPYPIDWHGSFALGDLSPPHGGFCVLSATILKDELSTPDLEGQLKILQDETPVEGRKSYGAGIPNSPRYSFVEDWLGAVCHELGHALGLPHDYSCPVNIMGDGFRWKRHVWLKTPGKDPVFSPEAGGILAHSRYLTEPANPADQTAPRAKIEVFPGATPTLNRIIVNAQDNDNLGAAILYARKKDSLIAGKRLNGKREKIEWSIDSSLEGEMTVVISDSNGNLSRFAFQNQSLPLKKRFTR